MSQEKRVHPRVPCKVKVGYIFTSWKDRDLESLKKPLFTESNDISLVGIGLPQMKPIKQSLKKKLIEGKKKIKLGIFLYDDKPPVIVYGRLVWVDLKKEIKEHHHRGGLQFLDLSGDAYTAIQEYVDSHLGN